MRMFIEVEKGPISCQDHRMFMRIELRKAPISYQNHYMLCFSLADKGPFYFVPGLPRVVAHSRRTCLGELDHATLRDELGMVLY